MRNNYPPFRRMLLNEGNNRLDFFIIIKNQVLVDN